MNIFGWMCEQQHNEGRLQTCLLHSGLWVDKIQRWDMALWLNVWTATQWKLHTCLHSGLWVDKKRRWIMSPLLAFPFNVVSFTMTHKLLLEIVQLNIRLALMFQHCSESLLPKKQHYHIISVCKHTTILNTECLTFWRGGIQQQSWTNATKIPVTAGWYLVVFLVPMSDFLAEEMFLYQSKFKGSSNNLGSLGTLGLDMSGDLDLGTNVRIPLER